MKGIADTELDVVGLGFRIKKEGRRALASIVAKRQVANMRLVREPDNKYDENAVAVYLPDRLMNGMRIGYLHRETAEVLAPKLDSGKLTVVGAWLVSLDGADDFKTAKLHVRFQNHSAAKEGR